MKLDNGGGQGDGDVSENIDAQVAGPTIISNRHASFIHFDKWHEVQAPTRIQ